MLAAHCMHASDPANKAWSNFLREEASISDEEQPRGADALHGGARDWFGPVSERFVQLHMFCQPSIRSCAVLSTAACHSVSPTLPTLTGTPGDSTRVPCLTSQLAVPAWCLVCSYSVYRFSKLNLGDTFGVEMVLLIAFLQVPTRLMRRDSRAATSALALRATCTLTEKLL
jgi:hypothetical protein